MPKYTLNIGLYRIVRKYELIKETVTKMISQKNY